MIGYILAGNKFTLEIKEAARKGEGLDIRAFFGNGEIIVC